MVAFGNKTLGLISDTHGLLREEALRALEGSALILHTGDVGAREVLDRLREIAPVIAVRGNVDKASWAEELPLTQAVEVEGRVLYMLHEIEKLDLDPAAAGFSVVVFGHSHQPSVKSKEGVLYVNPGSAGPRRFKLPVTVGRLRFSGRVPSAEIVELSV